MEEKGLWHYFEKWQKLSHGRDPLKWLGSRMENAWCAECGFCCGKQDNPEPFPMALLPSQIGPETPNDFHMLSPDTAGLGAEGCKSLGSRGCRLPHAKRPVACGLFPIVLANGGLHLYQICPAAMFLPLAHFYKLAKETAEYLDGFSLEELRHLSISLSDRTLMDKYINLHARLFDGEGKKLLFE